MNVAAKPKRNRYANAGGYCHRSDTLEGPKSEVFFSDDMTPRLDWTWDRGNAFASLSIRFFCWQHCSCTINPSKDPLHDNLARSLWAYAAGHEMIQRSNGAMYIRKSNPTGHRSTVQVLPPQQGAGSPSGRCGVNVTDFCPQDWDHNAYGPVPRVPPNVTDIVMSPTDPDSMVCGNTCQSTSDCSTTDRTYSCSCAFPSSDDARKLGLDPVLPGSMCLALFVALGQSNLGGRDISSHVDARGVPHTCRCNGTVMGMQCCGKMNGVLPALL